MSAPLHPAPSETKEAADGCTQAEPEAKDSETVLKEALEKLRAKADGLNLPALSQDAMPAAEGGDQAKAPSKYHQDAQAIFVHLINVTLQDLAPNQPESRAVTSCKLSLTLMRDLLQQCGPILKTSEPFIVVMKEQLCTMLTKNSMSAYSSIFVLSLQIMVVLIKSFRDRLKAEVGIFIEQIVLRILDSGSSTYHFKYRVLQVLDRLCADATTALELFLNFDCDEHESNLFERTIDCLSKIAQGKYTASEHASIIQPQQEQDLKMFAFKALVKLVNSLVEWTDRRSGAQDANGSQTRTASSRELAENADVATDADVEDDVQSDCTLATTGSVGCAPNSVVRRKQRKRELQTGVSKFNMKPKKGIEHLRQSGFITDEPAVIAEFFKRTDVGLDKTTIGDYLGELKPFNISVMNSLVDSLDFVGIELDAALRTFLSIFRLPGEAQKIERLMEKFADKYCGDNPSKFSNSDCAFVLSFAMIMLQTDLNNPQVKVKMTKDQFVSQNRGIDGGNNLPREYLEGIYDSVRETPFSLKEDDDAKARLESRAAKGEAQKHALFQRESQNIVMRSQEMLEQRSSRPSSGTFVQASNIEYVRPLFEVVCWPMLATLSVLLEMQEDQASVDLCMEGFKHSIRIAARFDMDTERESIVSSLAKFTYLTTIKEMRQKNIDCIKALLHLGLSEGNNLGPSWQYVLICISQLERLQLIKNRAREDFQFFVDTDGGFSPPSRSGSFNGFMTPTSSSGGSNNASGAQVRKRRAYGTGISATVAVGSEEQQVELENSHSVMSQIDGSQIDLLFNKSTALDSTAIVHFVTQLTRVSREELQSIDQPRIFALQKLVEVADYNLNRSPQVWSRIWNVMSHHFVEAAAHPNAQIGMYTMDSLRQMTQRFVGREELQEFQSELLGPFEAVINKTPGPSRELKELIMSSVSKMVLEHLQDIKVGWKTVFRILRAASKEHDSEVVPERAYAVIEAVFEQYYELFAENFSDGIFALSALGQCKASKDISLKSIRYLLQACERLAKSETSGPSFCREDTNAADAGGGGRVEHWLLVLQGLTTLVSDPRQDVRTAALRAVHTCLCVHGGPVFDEEMWRTVLKGVIRPLFDEVQHQLSRGDATLAPIVSGVVLKSLKDLQPEQFSRCLPELFPLLCELVSVDSLEVRQTVQDIFLNQVSPLLTPLARGALGAPGHARQRLGDQAT